MYNYKIRYTPFFDENIEEIYNYIAYTVENPSSANKILKAIHDKAHSLELFPKGNPTIITRGGMEYRSCHIKRYSIIYHIDENSKTVSVDYVFYSRRNLLKLIK